MTASSLLVALGTPLLLFVSGWALVACVPASRAIRPRALRLGIAYPLGVAWTAGLAYAASHLFAIPLGPRLTLALALLPVAALVLRRRGRIGTPPRPPRGAVVVTLLAAGAFVTAALLLEAVTNPISDWDGRMTWGTQAKYVADARSVDAPALREARWWVALPRYPLLLPVAQSLAITLDGGADERVVRPLYVAFFPSLLLVVWGAARRWGRAAASFACAEALLAPFLAFHSHGGASGAYSDLPLACFFGGAIALLTAGAATMGTGCAAGFLLAAAVLSKNEGLSLAVLALVAGALARALRPRGRRRFTSLAPAALLAAAASLFLAFWRAGIPDRWSTDYPLPGFGVLAAMVRLLPAILARCVAVMCRPAQWGALWWVAPLLLVAGAAALVRRRTLPWVAATLGMLGFCTAVYATSFASGELIEKTWDRFLVQMIVPLLVVAAALSAEALRIARRAAAGRVATLLRLPGPLPWVPVGRGEAALLVAAFAIVVILRLLTVAPDTWEWDEILFLRAARNGIDVRVGQPHAPGYPGFVYPARLLVLLGVSPFRAITALGVVGGLLAVLGVYALVRALGGERRFAALGAAAFALIPAVWLHSVRPLTDGLAAAGFLFSLALLVRAVRNGSGRELVLAAAASALTAAVRPQAGISLLPFALVAAVVVFRRGARPRMLAAAVAVGIGVTALIWTPLVLSSGGLSGYREALDAAMHQVQEFDAPKAPDFATRDFWERWLVDPFGHRRSLVPIAAFALTAFFLRRRPALAGAALFVPAAAISIGTLDRYVAPRYALSFLPAVGVLVAFAAEGLSRTRLRAVAVPIAAAAILWMIAPSIPAIVEVHARSSPPVAVMEEVRRRYADRRVVLTYPTLIVHVVEYLPGRQLTKLENGVAAVAPAGSVIVWADGNPVGQTPAFRSAFVNADQLSRISRGRYMNAALFDARIGAALDEPRVSGPGWWDGGRGLAALGEPGAVLRIASASPSAELACTVETDTGVLLRVATGGASRDVAFPAGRHRFEARAGTVAGELISFTVLEGRSDLREFRIVAR